MGQAQIVRALADEFVPGFGINLISARRRAQGEAIHHRVSLLRKRQFIGRRKEGCVTLVTLH
jgi:hypothetical protein